MECESLSSILHCLQAMCSEVLCDVLEKEVEEALTANVGVTQSTRSSLCIG